MKREKILQIVLIFSVLILLAYVDFVVVELIHHKLSSEGNVGWGDFGTNLVFGKNNIEIFTWYLAFFPLAFSLFLLFGIALRSWRFSVSGLVMFATGWEDIFYYFIQGRWLPETLSWLNASPLIALSRYLTFSENVTSFGLIISCVIGLLVAGVILFWKEIKEIPRKRA